MRHLFRFEATKFAVNIFPEIALRNSFPGVENIKRLKYIRRMRFTGI